MRPGNPDDGKPDLYPVDEGGALGEYVVQMQCGIVEEEAGFPVTDSI